VCPKVEFKPVSPEIPEEGSVPVTFEGMALQTEAGKLDAVTFTYL
jgi:hypothetical protein